MCIRIDLLCEFPVSVWHFLSSTGSPKDCDASVCDRGTQQQVRSQQHSTLQAPPGLYPVHEGNLGERLTTQRAWESEFRRIRTPSRKKPEMQPDRTLEGSPPLTRVH